MTEIKAQLKIDGNADAIDLPVYQGSTGPDVVDVRALVSQGVFTYDPGFVSTASCESKITYIDGAAGVLLHRGYPIEQLAEKSNFLETCYLLLHGELPDKTQHDQFVNSIRYHTMVDEAIHQFFRGFPRTAHPMAMLCGVVGALSAFYHDSLDNDNPEHRIKAAHRVIAKMPTLAAMCYKHGIGQPFMYPQNDMGFAENFLHMMFGTPCEPPRSARCWPKPSIHSSCSMRIMNRMRRLQLYDSPGPRVPIRMPASLPELLRSGGLLTAAQMKLCWTC